MSDEPHLYIESAEGQFILPDALHPRPEHVARDPITVTRCMRCKHIFRNPDHDEECDCPIDALGFDHSEGWEVVEATLGRVLETVIPDGN